MRNCQSLKIRRMPKTETPLAKTDAVSPPNCLTAHKLAISNILTLVIIGSNLDSDFAFQMSIRMFSSKWIVIVCS